MCLKLVSDNSSVAWSWSLTCYCSVSAALMLELHIHRCALPHMAPCALSPALPPCFPPSLPPSQNSIVLPLFSFCVFCVWFHFTFRAFLVPFHGQGFSVCRSFRVGSSTIDTSTAECRPLFRASPWASFDDQPGRAESAGTFCWPSCCVIINPENTILSPSPLSRCGHREVKWFVHS